MFYTWLTSSFIRNFPQTAPKRSKPMKLKAALNEKFSFQVALRLMEEEQNEFTIELDTPEKWTGRIRRIGFVPVRHHNYPLGSSDDISSLDVEGNGFIPGYVPDPLFDEQTILLPPGETHAFWISIMPAEQVEPGDYELVVTVKKEDEVLASHNVVVHLQDIRLNPIANFNISHWLCADAIIDWYKTDLFDDRFWQILSNYLINQVDHGINTLLVPAITPPVDGIKRPVQLLKISKKGKSKYEFDWSDVKTYIKLARKCGMTHFEWPHLYTQGGAKFAPCIYESQGEDEKLLWPENTEAEAPIYTDFLKQFLPELQAFLKKEKILKSSLFHLADEPGSDHLDAYRNLRETVRDIAPWMTVMDALEVEKYVQEGLVDMAIANVEDANDIMRHETPCWCYYAGRQRGKTINRLLDSPLPKIAMHGFVFYRWQLQGFLHWGYNYWYKAKQRELIDPYHIQDGLNWEQGWSYGDTFMVYPGEEGPIDSMRWEVFSESLQDYALLQTLGLDREHKILAAIKAFDDFPKTEKWRLNAREKCYNSAKSD